MAETEAILANFWKCCLLWT